MSSRLTAPVSQLARCFSTTPAVARPSHLLNHASKAAAAATGAGRITKPAVDEPSERQHSTAATTPHRPLVPKTTPAMTTKTIPFMQTFHHSAPKPIAPTFSTIDRAILPDLFEPTTGTTDPYAHIRVPLLPEAEESYEMGAGMIRDLWRGMVDDVLGPAGRNGGKGAAPA
jgi:hypothetical protein